MEEITVTENAIKTESQSKKIKLRAGEKLKRDEALKLMLIISADPIAGIHCRTYCRIKK